MPKLKAPTRTTLTNEATTPTATVGLPVIASKSAIPTDAALLSMPQIETLIGLNRTRVYKWLREGLFPQPIKLGKTSRWPRHEIEKWLAELTASRNLNEGGAA